MSRMQHEYEANHNPLRAGDNYCGYCKVAYDAQGNCVCDGFGNIGNISRHLTPMSDEEKERQLQFKPAADAAKAQAENVLRRLGLI